MNEIKRRQKESQYLLWLAKIISEEVTNANISYCYVIDCKLSSDGSHLKVYVSFEKNEAKSLAALNNSKGFIRTQLSQYDSGRKVPELSFVIDQVSKTGRRIDQLLEQIKKPDEGGDNES